MILTPAFLVKRRGIILADLLAKVEAEDWHGVQDCASDIREIEAQLVVFASGTGGGGVVKVAAEVTERWAVHSWADQDTLVSYTNPPSDRKGPQE